MRKKSIRTYYMRIIAALSIGLLLLLGAAYFYSTSMFEQRSEELVAQTEKAEVISELSDSISNLFFRTRGFYAFKFEHELKLAHEELRKIDALNNRLNSIELTEEEQQFTTEIHGFISNFEKVVLPKAIEFVDNDDYEGLRELSGAGTNLSVNQFIKYADQYEQQAQNARDDFYQKSERQLNQLYAAILFVGIAALLFLIFFNWRVVRKLISPIESMTTATERYMTDQDVNYEPIVREDELGSLSRSFAGMMGTIQVKEQELLAQNEELLSQQEELLSQQDELFVQKNQLEEALAEAKLAKVRLERYNGLSHQLSFSDDAKGIATSTLNYLDTLFVIDQGMIYLPSTDQHVLQGFSEEAYASYPDDLAKEALERLKTEPYFQIERESEDGTIAYDFYTAPQFTGHTFKALFVLSSSTREFSPEDQADLFALANRVSFAIDRIDQHELISRERQLNQTILDNLEEGIQFISMESRPVQVNQALSFLINQQAETLEQQDWKERMAELSTNPEALTTFINASLEDESTGLAETVYTVEGSEPKVITLYGSPVHYEGQRIGTLFVHRDITQAFEVDKMKTELVSTVSHELRTPLSSILGFTELLIGKEMDNTRRSRYLDAIYKEAKRLTSLINDFLDVQRMESGNQEYTMQEVNIADIAQQTIHNFPNHENHSITLEANEHHPICMGDPDRLIQVFTNLLSNAIKFSPDGGDVLVKLSEQGDHLKVTIQDQGIGIPADELKHMFEKFYRFDNTYRRKIGGTGLGLAICRKIVEKHGGEITVESEENVGTAVSFTIPIKPVQNRLPERSDLPAIVVVEDDPSIALLLEEELKAHEYEVFQFQDVASSFAYAKKNKPDCMVIDLMLKEELKGWDLIGILKDDAETRHIPIIISSALEREEELTRKFGISHYMTKPYPLRTLSETVATTLKAEDGRILYPTVE
ncbi:ATP-binding protein [Sporosarcina jeotgali]|uniref:histidine kinase n=1 Tax=Sporosarcina jeotgali TaxID=3020056 RepID=A0ABZ0KXG6_9BACL|nr:ATP-binding protein [Sporosarcina sp. B2O-1]WOV84057.1 ATP-binding protein [Sporosarcina sp. B2O-1]